MVKLTNLHNLRKGLRYIVYLGAYAYVIKQMGQRTWVATLINTDPLEGVEYQYIGNSKKLPELLRATGRSMSTYYAVSNISFKKGLMATLVGARPDATVEAKEEMNGDINIKVQSE